jgi:rSAM/selenodomain-associated transferase 1
MLDTALVFVARYPEAGKTKTRLAGAIGHDEAAGLYEAFLTDLAQRFAGSNYHCHWAYTPAERNFAAFISTLTPALAQSMHYFPQEGADLGARLLSAFQWTFQQAFQKTIVVGSDSPHISLEVIEEARVALDEADVVLGPAEDGGYYLIAMRQPHDVFSGIPMSTNVVAQMTIERAQRQGLTIRLLEPLFDIDELPDLLRLAYLLEANSSLAPATAAYLARRRELHDRNTYNYTTAFNLHRTHESL